MTHRRLTMLSVAIVAMMLLAGFCAAVALPAALNLPVHWDFNGQPDRFTNKWIALLTPAAATALTAAIFHTLPMLEPRREGLERSRGLYFWVWISLLLVGLVSQAALILVAWGVDVPIVHILVTTLGFILCLAGNQFGKSRSMYFLGIRTPWTLTDEDLWIRTHRLAGKLLVIGGLALVLAGLLKAASGLLISLLLATLIVGLVVPAGYSYVLWRRKNGSRAGGKPNP